MRQFLLAMLMSLVAVSGTFAAELTIGNLVIEAPWSRATPPGAKTGAAYFVITNKGTTDDKLVSIVADVSSSAQLHEMGMENGVMTMRALPDGVVVPAGGKIEFKPGGYHVMFVGLKAPLKEGDHLKAQLVFEKAGTITVDFPIGSLGQTKPQQHDMPM